MRHLNIIILRNLLGKVGNGELLIFEKIREGEHLKLLK
jgi:hypothetical protein